MQNGERAFTSVPIHVNGSPGKPQRATDFPIEMIETGSSTSSGMFFVWRTRYALAMTAVRLMPTPGISDVRPALCSLTYSLAVFISSSVPLLGAAFTPTILAEILPASTGTHRPHVASAAPATVLAMWLALSYPFFTMSPLMLVLFVSPCAPLTNMAWTEPLMAASRYPQESPGQSAEILLPPMVSGWHWKFTRAISCLPSRTNLTNCSCSSGSPVAQTTSGFPTPGFVRTVPSFILYLRTNDIPFASPRPIMTFAGARSERACAPASAQRSAIIMFEACVISAPSDDKTAPRDASFFGTRETGPVCVCVQARKIASIVSPVFREIAVRTSLYVSLSRCKLSKENTSARVSPSEIARQRAYSGSSTPSDTRR